MAAGGADQKHTQKQGIHDHGRVGASRGAGVRPIVACCRHAPGIRGLRRLAIWPTVHALARRRARGVRSGFTASSTPLQWPGGLVRTSATPGAQAGWSYAHATQAPVPPALAGSPPRTLRGAVSRISHHTRAGIERTQAGTCCFRTGQLSSWRLISLRWCGGM